MKYYAVIDTNVLVSAMLKWQSVPGKILELTFNGIIIPVINDEIVNEYRTVLSRPKFKLPEEIVNDIISEIEEKGIYVNEKTLDEYLPDPKDRVFYEVVMEERNSQDAYLVTGNIKHFPVSIHSYPEKNARYYSRRNILIQYSKASVLTIGAFLTTKKEDTYGIQTIEHHYPFHRTGQTACNEYVSDL